MLVNIIWSRDKRLGPSAHDHLVHVVPNRECLSGPHHICSVHWPQPLLWEVQLDVHPLPGLGRWSRCKAKGELLSSGCCAQARDLDPYRILATLSICPLKVGGEEWVSASTECSGPYNQDLKILTLCLVLCTSIIPASSTEQKIHPFSHLERQK